MTCETCGNPLISGAVFCPYCGRQVEGTHEHVDYTYEAFISYRHLPHDRRQAMYLQRSIEGFRIPRSLRHEAGRTRLGKCFRDEDELPTAGSLPDQIRDALMRSRFLFVICSRETCKSRWVLQEVEQFASLHGRDRVRLVLIDGEPDESFPPLMLKRLEVSDDGQILERDAEPLAADFRSSEHRKLRIERLRLIAPIIGCAFDDLRQRQRQRAMRMALTSATAIAIGSTAFGSFSLYQQRQIERNYRNTQIRESELLAENALKLTESGDRYQAIQVALAALPSSSTSNDRPFVPAAQVALEKALGIYPSGYMFESLYSTYDVSAHDRAHAYSESGLMALVDADGQVLIIEMGDGSEVCTIDIEKACGIATSTSVWNKPLMEFVGNSFIYATCDSAAQTGDSGSALIACFDAHTGELQWHVDEDSLHSCKACALSHDGRTLAALSDDDHDMNERTRTLYLIDTNSGPVVRDYRLPSDDRNPHLGIAFNEDDKVLAVVADEHCTTIDLSEGNMHRVALEDNGIYETGVSLTWVDGRIAALFHEDGIYRRDYSLQLYDSDLSFLWEKSGSTFTSLVEATGGFSDSPTFKICGAVGEEQGSGRMLVALLNSHILLLEKNTGKEVCSLKRDAPFVACRIFGSNAGTETIGTLTADGEFIMRNVMQVNTDTWEDYSGYDTSFVPACGMGDIVRNEEGLFLVGRTEFPAQYKLSRLVSDEAWGAFFEDAEDRVPLTLWNVDQKTYLAGFSDENLGIFAASDPSEVLLIDMDQLSEIDQEDTASRKLVPSLREPSVYVSGARTREGFDDTGYIAYELSAKTGEILRQIDLGEQVGKFSEISLEDGSRALLVESSHEVRIASFDGLSDVAATLDSQDFVSTALYAQGRIIVFINKGAVALFDGKTGEQVTCDLGSFSGHILQKLSGDGSLLAIAYDDGCTRLFDTKTGSLLWASDSSTGGINHLAFAPATNDVLQQDESGVLSLLSQADGSVLAATTSSLPHIFESWELNDPSLLAVHCDDSRATWLTREKVAVVNLDSASFGQTSVIDNGVGLSADGKLAILRNPQDGRYSVMNHLTLDELISRANQVTKGHELTDAERSRFHLDAAQ